MSPRLLVVGSSNTDLVCTSDRLPRPGETVTGTSFSVHAGGKAANQAVAAARAGASVCFLGAVGDDDYGRARLADLERDGVDVSNVLVREAHASGIAIIIVDSAGQNQIVTVGGANDTLTASEAGSATRRAGHDALLLTFESPLPAIEAALQSNPAGNPVFLNAAPFDPAVRDFMPWIDVLICNEIEAAGVLGREVHVEEAEEAVEQLLALGYRQAIITIGEAGAVGAGPEGVFRVPAPAVSVVDTTGAGDAFCGVFATWMMSGAGFRDSVGAGVAAGSLAVTKAGAQPSLPDRESILHLLGGLA